MGKAKETHHWLRLLRETGYLQEALFVSPVADCEKLCKLLFSIEDNPHEEKLVYKLTIDH